jgi:hypothetical protein
MSLKTRFHLTINLTILVVLLAGWIPASARAAAFNQAGQSAQGVQMIAQAAFGGNFKYGEWLPIWVELGNQGQDIEAEVQIGVSGSMGRTVFSAPVSLPSGSRKLVPVYILPNNYSREIQVNLITDGQSLATQKVAVQPKPNINLFIGIITPERGALGLLSAVTVPGQDRPKTITDLQIADLPDKVEGLRSFDLLIINNTDTSRLTPDQATALLSWVQSGGRLVVGGGTGAAQTFAGLPELLQPVTLQGSIQVDVDALTSLVRYSEAEDFLTTGTFIAAVGQVIDSSIIAGSETLPLLVERPIGSGYVNFSALDLSGAPFNGWPGTEKLWSTMILNGARYPENMPWDMSIRQMRANQLSYALSNIPSLDLPSLQGISLLLFVYILIVGPVNYLVLKWRKQLQLAWVTIPAITLLFTAGAFGIGYGLRGTDLILNRISIVQLQAGGNASVTDYMGLFSPRQQSYEIKVFSEGLISPMTGYDPGPWSGMGPTGGGEMVFVQGQPSLIKGLSVNQFSMQSFVAEDIWNDFGSLTTDLRLENDKMIGTITNNTSQKITDVIVVFQNRYGRAGDLDPGQTGNVEIVLNAITNDRWGPSIAWRIFQENQTGMPSRTSELKSNILSSVIDNGFAQKMMLSSTFPPSGGGSMQQGGSPIFVFGWMNESTSRVEVNDNRLAQQTTALVYTTSSFKLPESGPLNIPLGMVPGNLTANPKDGGMCGPMNMASVSMGMGEAEFEFYLPIDAKRHKVNELKLNFWRDTGNNWDMPKLSFWNWEAAQWTQIKDPIMGTNIVKSPENYISESGVIRVKLVNDNNMYSCMFLDMGLSAEILQSSGDAQ